MAKGLFGWQKASIGTKVLIITLAGMIITVAAVFMAATNRYNAFLDEISLKQAQTSLGELSNRVADIGRQTQQNVLLLGGDDSILQATGQKDYAALTALLESRNKIMQLDMLVVTDGQGNTVARASGAQDDVAGQPGIKAALAGNTLSAIEEDSSAKLRYCAYSPLMDEQGRVTGAIAAGYTLDRDDMLDSLKGIHETDLTIFSGNICMATTIIQDGKRVVGTPLSAALTETVVTKGKAYNGQAEILGVQYVTAYMPLPGENGSPVGVLFAGKPMSEVNAEKNTILMYVLILSIILFAAVCRASFWSFGRT